MYVVYLLKINKLRALAGAHSSPIAQLEVEEVKITVRIRSESMKTIMIAEPKKQISSFFRYFNFQKGRVTTMPAIAGIILRLMRSRILFIR